MSNRTIEAVLRLSAKLGNLAAFRRLGDNLDKIDNKARRFNRAQGAIAAGGRNMHATLMRYAAPAALTYGAKAAFTDFADLERRMTRIGITAESTDAQTKAAYERAQSLAHRYAMPVAELIDGLEVLVAAGRNLDEAMAFLPTVALNAQATGASIVDVANMSEKMASALGILPSALQDAMDRAIAGAQAGQFEMEDMAARFPELANSFASLGYKGVEGAQMLITIMQTLREDTGSAEAAATQAANIFGKMYAPDTAKRFKEFGIDLRAELAAATAAGEDLTTAFANISLKAIDGDMTRLTDLFRDQEFRMGMQSLMSSLGRLDYFRQSMSGPEIAGIAERNLSRVLDDARAKIDQMTGAWEKLKMSIGASIAPALGGAMGGLAESINKADAINTQLEKEGWSFGGRRGWWFLNGFDTADQDDKAWRGGYRTDEERRLIDAHAEHAQSRALALSPATGEIPLPTWRPDPSVDPEARLAADIDRALSKGAPRRKPYSAGQSPRDAENHSLAELKLARNEIADLMNERASRHDVMADGPSRAMRFLLGDFADGDRTLRQAMQFNAGLTRRSDKGEQELPSGSDFASDVETALADGGQAAGQSIADSAREIESAGAAFGRIVESIFSAIAPSIGAKIAEGINANVRPVKVQQAGPGLPSVSGVRGRTGENAGTTAYGGR